jgi:GH15 family glucan-1,4-alpha-glucosidase
MTWEYTRADNGNVAIVAEIDHLKSQRDFVLSLGFGEEPDEAAHNAVASVRDGFDKAKHDYVAGWQEWMKTHPHQVKARSADFRQPAHPLRAKAALHRHYFPDLVVDAVAPEPSLLRRRTPTFCKAPLKKSIS